MIPSQYKNKIIGYNINTNTAPGIKKISTNQPSIPSGKITIFPLVLPLTCKTSGIWNSQEQYQSNSKSNWPTVARNCILPTMSVLLDNFEALTLYNITYSASILSDNFEASTPYNITYSASILSDNFEALTPYNITYTVSTS